MWNMRWSHFLSIVRYNNHYYVTFTPNDTFENVATKAIESIPVNPTEYQEWLRSQREKYRVVEEKFGLYFDDNKAVLLDKTIYGVYVGAPSELPRLDEFNSKYTLITNLDKEILTMNYFVHWKLDNIPREDKLWLRAIEESISTGRPSINLSICPEEHMATPAVPRVSSVNEFEYKPVTPKQHVRTMHGIFRSHMAVGVLNHYRNEIYRFGLEWTPDALPFRELVFAVVSLAANSDGVHFLTIPRLRETYEQPKQSMEDVYQLKPRPAARARLCDLGSSMHLSGLPPGAAPLETTYWFEGVVVHLTLTVDMGSISEAVKWGWEQGREHFQVIVISLFKVAFAEVKPKEKAGETVDNKPFVYATKAFSLTSLSEKACSGSQQRQLPVNQPGPSRPAASLLGQQVLLLTRANGFILPPKYTGIPFLMDFLDVAASRRAAVKKDHCKTGIGRLPPEILGQILDFTDYDTWKACLLVSPQFRSQALNKFRVDDRYRIVGDAPDKYRNNRHMVFNFEDLDTGAIEPMIESSVITKEQHHRWVPVLGREGERQAVMRELLFQFRPPKDTDADQNVESLNG